MINIFNKESTINVFQSKQDIRNLSDVKWRVRRKECMESTCFWMVWNVQIKAMLWKIPTSVIYSIHCITNAILCSRNKYVDHISEKVLPSIKGEIINMCSSLSMYAFFKDTFPSGVLSHKLYIYAYFLAEPTTDVSNGIRHTIHHKQLYYFLAQYAWQ
jgi:hypothetical protein